MRYEIAEFNGGYHTVYLIIDTQHDIEVDSFDTLTDDDAHNNALIRCDVFNCILGEVYND